MSPLRDLRCLKCFKISSDIFFHREEELKDWKCPHCGAVGEFEMLPPKIAYGKLKTPFHDSGESEK